MSISVIVGNKDFMSFRWTLFVMLGFSMWPFPCNSYLSLSICQALSWASHSFSLVSLSSRAKPVAAVTLLPTLVPLHYSPRLMAHSWRHYQHRWTPHRRPARHRVGSHPPSHWMNYLPGRYHVVIMRLSIDASLVLHGLFPADDKVHITVKH